MKNTVTKIFAIFALAWIVIWVIWTWVLFFMTGSNSEQETQITKEQLDAIIASSSWASVSSWDILSWTLAK